MEEELEEDVEVDEVDVEDELEQTKLPQPTWQPLASLVI